MKELKITLWNQDTLTIPYINNKYTLRSVTHHMKLLLKQKMPEQQEEEP